MDINVDKLDNVTQRKYREFADEVERLLTVYQETDNKRFQMIKEKIEQTNGNWDKHITLNTGDIKEQVDISQLLAYEYCLATERITQGKVSFESMLEKLFDGVKKFRIGNPIPGRDDECLYGKSIEDKSSIPVTTKKYRMVMRAGAQHLDYVSDGEITSAVFIYEKGMIKGFAKDELGNPINYPVDGINFTDLRRGQSLLTNLRQTAFHEWTHNSEKEIIEPTETNMEYEYQSEDGKTYRNYSKISSYVTCKTGETLKEPDYIYGTYINEKGEETRGFYYVGPDGNKRGIDTIKFDLQEHQLGKETCISTGLSTLEVMDNGKTKIHNIITEGFVEEIAREMIRAINPDVKDIDEQKYPEYVEIAKSVIGSRDGSLEKEGQGQTYADFLMHSSTLKKDLESRTVVLDNGSKIDGLHYLSNYAEKVQKGKTRKAIFFSGMEDVAKRLNLSEKQIDIVRDSNIWTKRELDEKGKETLRILLSGGKQENQDYVDDVIKEFTDILEEEKSFFHGIAEKLGYKSKTISTRELGMQTWEEQNDTSLLDDISDYISKKRGEREDNLER